MSPYQWGRTALPECALAFFAWSRLAERLVSKSMGQLTAGFADDLSHVSHGSGFRRGRHSLRTVLLSSSAALGYGSHAYAIEESMTISNMALWALE